MPKLLAISILLTCFVATTGCWPGETDKYPEIPEFDVAMAAHPDFVRTTCRRTQTCHDDRYLSLLSRDTLIVYERNGADYVPVGRVHPVSEVGQLNDGSIFYADDNHSSRTASGGLLLPPFTRKIPFDTLLLPVAPGGAGDVASLFIRNADNPLSGEERAAAARITAQRNAVVATRFAGKVDCIEALPLSEPYYLFHFRDGTIKLFYDAHAEWFRNVLFSGDGPSEIGVFGTDHAFPRCPGRLVLRDCAPPPVTVDYQLTKLDSIVDYYRWAATGGRLSPGAMVPVRQYYYAFTFRGTTVRFKAGELGVGRDLGSALLLWDGFFGDAYGVTE
ncbi:hypothetical protein [Neolewinella antarctica]|uniref:Uncharacterized protein n=1 Tax=Neolewinella antarctica TaxID=442734 RepID=A0ABX0XDN6_9BACT|nr:hypothetical protein [Neolewinella antarctica]NJC27019.1 hypothetical protein [Neolewinella antarctica]